MGSANDAEIAIWQERAGIEPATGDCLRLIEELQASAFKLIKTLELEKSGIRDGHGGWVGSDAVGGEVRELTDLYQSFDEYRMAKHNREVQAHYGYDLLKDF